jgi:hypothetical protein
LGRKRICVADIPALWNARFSAKVACQFGARAVVKVR